MISIGRQSVIIARGGGFFLIKKCTLIYVIFILASLQHELLVQRSCHVAVSAAITRQRLSNARVLSSAEMRQNTALRSTVNLPRLSDFKYVRSGLERHRISFVLYRLRVIRWCNCECAQLNSWGILNPSRSSLIHQSRIISRR